MATTTLTDVDRIRSALDHVPAHDRETWVRVGMAVKSELGEDGFDLWDAWSEQADSYSERDARSVWRSIRANGRVTIGTLYHEARANGWRDDGTHRAPTPEEIAERKRANAERTAREEAQRAQERASAATKAAALWRAAAPARSDHPYLTRKGVAPVPTLRQISDDDAIGIIGYRPSSSGNDLVGRLLVVPVKVGDALATVELIDGAGRKAAIHGGAKAGGFWAAQQLPDGDGAGQTILIGEGVATCLSAREAAGHPVIAVLSSGNLVRVATTMRERYPAATIILLADLIKATGVPDPHAVDAARAVGGFVAIPEFGVDRQQDDKDCNDLMRIHGPEAVARAIANARAPASRGDAHETAQVPDVLAQADDRMPATEEWPEPRPLPDGLAPVDAFDLDMLPTALRAWVGDIADRVQCPPDFVAVAAVTAMGSVLGRGVAIRPQARTDWSEVANQWGLIIGRPGVLKSPAIDQALAPLKRLEAIAREQHAEDKSTYQALAIAQELRAKVNKRAAEKALAKDRGADVRKFIDNVDEEEVEEPTCRRYTTSDTSCESLAELVRQNPNGMLVHRDEIVSLLRDLDREEKAGARGFFLSGWNGSTPYTVDRIGRGLDLHIPAVCLSLLGSTQPARIAEYVHAATHGGRGDDGLIQRFGLMVWPDIGGEWRNVDRWPDSEAKNQAFAAFARLDSIDPAAISAQRDTGIDGEPEGLPFLRFAPDALETFVEWRSDLERRLRSDELSPALVSHLNKYRKLIPSLALLFHLADSNSGPVDREALLRALAWAEYLETHAARVYASGPASEAATARAILTRIRRGDLPAVFAGWEVWRPGWANLADRTAVADGLALLTDHGYLAVSRVETSGRTATRYTVNPRGTQ